MDEVQSIPDLFVSIKASVDKNSRPGRFLLLGSSSPALLRQSVESLAGRIIYQKLGPFSVLEFTDLKQLWLRGGFPRSVLAPNDHLSMTWRNSFIQTFLERDLLRLKQGISPSRMRMLWNMLAHLHGQVINYSMISKSLDVSGTTIANYLDLLEGALMVERIPPHHLNIRKRLVKSPKLYLSDTGILHSFLAISTYEALLNHPIRGGSFEGLVLQNIRAALPEHRVSFYRTAQGAEVDFILEKNGKIIAVEVKSSSSPNLTKGFWSALNDINPSQTWIVAPVKEPYALQDNIRVANLDTFIKTLHKD